ncbi:MAG: PIG-L family deacetylase [Candidatus Omnitrophica bacterium]|nr:PIG-L family deacetylase [Candidatus Omnitrophota bacterium]
MKKALNTVFFLLGLLLCVSILSQLRSPDTLADSEFDDFTGHDRVLIIAPHPDDETIGCAGVIQQAKEAGAKVKVAYLTNGDCNQLAFMVYEKRITMLRGEFVHMGEVRRSEAVKAMELLGVDKSDLIFLGYPDFGTFAIFRDYWQTNKPFKALLTRARNVPYKENLSYGAPYTGDSILKDFKKIILDFKPNKIFVSHPSDVNGDHKAAYLFLQVALADLDKEVRKPKIYPYLIHYVGWPLPKNYHPGLDLNPPAQLNHSEIDWVKLKLSSAEVEKKHQALLAYRSQTESSAFYLLSFVRSNELFGDYGEVDIIREHPSLKKVSYSGLSNLFREYRDNNMYLPEKGASEEEHGQVSFAVADKMLLIRMQKSKEIRRFFNFQVYLFGYSRKVPFSAMPKIRILCKRNNVKVLSGRHPVSSQGAVLERDKAGAVLKIPMSLLGEPDFILTSIKAFGSTFSFDTTGFRRLNIE